MVERQYNRKVKIVRSDNGTEFTCMKSYFLEQGIIFQTSCTGTPQQNGRVERKHRHILNVARALRFQGNLPIDSGVLDQPHSNINIKWKNTIRSVTRTSTFL
jgi:hypothetical protein